MTAVRTRGAVLALTLAAGGARADDPPLKPGRDPGGTAVAILADGFDYTVPELAQALARDGEGEAIAWDTADGDGLPFAAEGNGTAAARAAAARGGVRIVQVRVDARDAGALAKGVAFAMQTPARIVLAPLPAGDATGRDVLVAAAQKFETALFVASRPDLADDDRKLTDDRPNLILIDAGEGGLAAAEAVARALGCGQGELTGTTGAELKRAFLDRLEKASAPGCEPKGPGKAKQP